MDVCGRVVHGAKAKAGTQVRDYRSRSIYSHLFTINFLSNLIPDYLSMMI